MRAGAAFLATARAKAGLADSSVGSVRQAPSPRSTWRRDRLSKRSNSRLCFFMSVRCGHGGLGTHLLERRRIDNAQQQGGELAVMVVESLHDPVDGFHVVVLGAPAGGVGQQLGAERTVEVGTVPVDEDTLELAHAAEAFARDQAAFCHDGLFALRVAPHADAVEVLEAEADGVHAVVAGAA